ncbi:MAG: hypothetical protein C4294_18475 [Nitrospiraceae bacterium]
MELKNYKINKAYEIKAKKLGMSMNEYLGHLQSLVENERTSQGQLQLTKMEKLESIVQSLVTLRQTDKLVLDVMTKRIGTLTDTITLQTELLGSKLAFIDAIQKELTK